MPIQLTRGIWHMFWFILILPTKTFWASNVYQSCKGLKLQRLQCSFWHEKYFMILHGTLQLGGHPSFLGVPPSCDSAFESDLPELGKWWKMQMRIPKVWPSMFQHLQDSAAVRWHHSSCQVIGSILWLLEASSKLSILNWPLLEFSHHPTLRWSPSLPSSSDYPGQTHDKTAWNLKFHHCSMFVAWCERLSQNASLWECHGVLCTEESSIRCSSRRISCPFNLQENNQLSLSLGPRSTRSKVQNVQNVDISVSNSIQ